MKELLTYIKGLPAQLQNKILVDAYGQIADLHDSGQSFASFSWKNCRLAGGRLKINAPIDD